MYFGIKPKRSSFSKYLKRKKIKYAYSLERVIAPENDTEIAFPMISMCNLPLSEFSGYISKYGGYSLGLSQQWGKANGFTSVWYCDDTSKIRKSLVDDLKKKDKTGEINALLVKVYSYIKLTEDQMPKRNYLNYRFADEREVRLVPSSDELNKIGSQALLVKQAYEMYKAEHGNPTINLDVAFDLSDLRYLIVPTAAEAKKVSDFFYQKGITLLIPILTHQQILEDFIGKDHNKLISIVDNLTADELIKAARKSKQSSKERIAC